MKLVACLFLIGTAALSQEAKPTFAIRSASDLVGKKVTFTDRIALCTPATYNADLSHMGNPATVVAAKPQNLPRLSPSQLARLNDFTRNMMLEQYTAAVLTFQFDDGVKLDTCGVPYSAKKFSESLQLATGESVVVASDSVAQKDSGNVAIDHLSDTEVKAALGGSGSDYFVQVLDANFFAYGGQRVQNIRLLRPEFVISQRQASSKKQFKGDYTPTDDDRERALIVEAEGYVGQTVAEGCTDITRVLLLSDESGTITREAYATGTYTSQWGNALGATTQCQELTAKFSVADVDAVRRAAKGGEFFIATFAGGQMTKMYKIKHKFQSKLDLDKFLVASAKDSKP